MQRLPRNLHLVATWRSPDNAIRKNTQHDTSQVLRLPCKMMMGTSKVLRLWERRKSNCACHTKRLSTRYQTRLNVTKCHACHAKRSNATLETSKNDLFCRTYQRHGHTALTRTVADGCERLQTVGQRRANTPSPPDPQSETGTLATHSAKTALTWKPLGIYVYLLDIYNYYIYIHIYIYTYIYILNHWHLMQTVRQCRLGISYV